MKGQLCEENKRSPVYTDNPDVLIKSCWR